jgi:UDP-galactopyranose mutase
MNAIWEIDPTVRFIHVDPILYRTAREHVNEKAHGYSEQFREIPYQAWDMISGKLHPELGGDPKYLDIIGANYYYTNQEWVEEHEDKFTFRPIEWYSKDRIPLEVLLIDIKYRYNRPIVLTETASFGTDRNEWWDRVLNEIDRGLKVGIPIKGVCAYPIIDWPDWFNDQFTNSGLWDFKKDDPTLIRVPHEGTIQLVKDYAKRWSNR